MAVERLTDAGGWLSSQEEAEIGVQLAEFERRLPQLFFLVYLGELPAPSSPRQFGFWLLNHAAVSGMEEPRPNENGMLLVIDPVAGSAALTAGYFLECYVLQEELGSMLRSVSKHLASGNFAGAVRGVLQDLTTVLMRRALEAAANPDAHAPPGPRAPAVFPAFMKLGEDAPPPAVPDVVRISTEKGKPPAPAPADSGEGGQG